MILCIFIITKINRGITDGYNYRRTAQSQYGGDTFQKYQAGAVYAETSFSMGYRYSINSKKVSGHPDIYLKNIIQQYLLTAVFGTGMKVVNIHICQNPELSFGRKSLR